MNAWRIALAVAAVIPAAPLAAQADTTHAHTLDPLVVTAERAGTPLSASTSAVTRIGADDVARTPGPTLASALQRVPGFSVLDFDGSGWDPQLVVRGFYGGGQAEYVVVLVDGRPINQLQTGLVPWDALPPGSAIQDIEVVRGSESALYGDAALGAVINVITRRGPSGLPIRWESSAGGFGSWSADAGATAAIGSRDITGSAGFDHTGGFRAHAARDGFRAQVDAPLVATAGTTLGLGVRSYLRAYDEPGPLLASLLAEDRTASDERFRFDHTHDASNAVSLTGERRVGTRTRLTGSLTGELRNTDAVQTLALAPGFGDTQQRRARNERAAAAVQLEIDDSPLARRGPADRRHRSWSRRARFPVLRRAIGRSGRLPRVQRHAGRARCQRHERPVQCRRVRRIHRAARRTRSGCRSARDTTGCATPSTRAHRIAAAPWSRRMRRFRPRRA